MDETKKKIALICIAVIAVFAVGFQAFRLTKGDEPQVVSRGPTIPPGHGMRDAEVNSQKAGKQADSSEDNLAGAPAASAAPGRN